MNLIDDHWIPTKQGDLSPSDVILNAATINWPRADWNAMTYMFLCGLLQTAIVRNPNLCPDPTAWEQLQKKPPKELDSWFEPLRDAFELYGDRGFMQVDVASEKECNDSALLPDMPGENTKKKNADLFVHRHEVLKTLTDAQRAIAIYTLGACGWSAGGGFLKNSRGGNALTTLLVPQMAERVWDTVWMNIFSAEQWQEEFEEPEFDSLKVFPWTNPLVRKYQEGKRRASPSQMGHIHVYWQMPMRDQWRDGSLFHEKGGSTGGLSYAEAGWRHPFTAYRLDAGNNRPISCNSNMGYQHWSPYLLGDNASIQALNISEHIRNRRPDARLWLFGWAVSQAEALTWVDVMTPAILGPNEDYSDKVGKLLTQVEAMSKRLFRALKNAKISRKVSLYHATESDWYRILSEVALETTDIKWSELVKKRAIDLFKVAASGAEPLDYARGLSVLRKT